MDDTLKVVVLVAVGHLAVLAAIIFIIKRLLLGDTLRAVKRISEAEAEIRKKEESMRQQLEQNERELGEKQAQLEEDFEKRKEEADRQVAQLKEEVIDDAKRDAAGIMDKARKSERKLREQLKQEMEQRAVDLGGRIFSMVFSENVTRELNAVFIDELLDALKETDATGITVDAEDAEFTASHPLTDDQRTRLQSILAEKFGVTVDVSETVREELLAGLILKLGSLEIDGSLLSRLEEAASELKKEALR